MSRVKPRSPVTGSSVSRKSDPGLQGWPRLESLRSHASAQHLLGPILSANVKVR